MLSNGHLKDGFVVIVTFSFDFPPRRCLCTFDMSLPTLRRQYYKFSAVHFCEHE